LPPRKRQRQTSTYTVFINAYATLEIKEQVERGEMTITQPSQLGGSQEYMGTSERQAAWHFYRAIRAAASDPLAYKVTMYRDGKLVAQATALHTL
jgi:hypothetical protein